MLDERSHSPLQFFQTTVPGEANLLRQVLESGHVIALLSHDLNWNMLDASFA